MKKLNYTIFINAPVEKVWDTMLDDHTYRAWTYLFSPGSYYKGNWEKGSTIYFLAPGQDGKPDSGMVSEIKENRRYEYISIHHLGMFEDGVENTSPEVIKNWGDALENYSFKPVGEGTELTVDLDVADEYVAMMDEMWPPALRKLKELAEN
jgi:uncharacterized protein YndB with AHSA1/START domain